MQAPAQQADELKTRRLLGASLAMLLIAGAVFGSLFFREHQAARGDYQQADHHLPSPAEAQQQREVRLTKAKLLREKFRPWALSHKDVLMRLIHAQPDDQAALMAAWDALPANPEKEIPGFHWSDIGSGSQGGVPWQPGDKGMEAHPSDVKIGKDIKAAEDYERRTLQLQFLSQRDIALTGLFDIGSAGTVCVWASGRVTEQRVPFTAHRDPLTHKIVLEDGPHKEVMPRYDFLS